MDYAVRITLSVDSPASDYTGGFWALGVAQLSAGAPASGWTSGQLVSCSQVGESVDIAKGGNYAILSDCTVAFSAVGWPTTAAAGVSLHNATVEVGTLSGSTLTPRWVGYVSDWEWTGTSIVVTCESLAGRRHREIPARRLTSDDLPNLPQASEGAAVPIVWGSVERMTPPKYSQDRPYLDAFYQVSGGAAVARKSTFLAGSPSGATMYIGLFGEPGGPTFSLPADHWTALLFAGDPVYLEIASGTGSGQTIRMASYSYGVTATDLQKVSITLDSAFSPQPDSTSELKIFSKADYASLAAFDEGIISRVGADVDGVEYEVAASDSVIDGIVVASVSQEFLVGANYQAITDYPGAYSYGAWLVDGVTQSGDSCSYLPITKAATGSGTRWSYIGDILCRTKIDTKSISMSNASSMRELRFLYSVFGINTTDIKSLIVHVRAKRYDGTTDLINVDVALTTKLIDTSDMSAYNTALRDDGADGNYSRHAIEMPDLPSILDAYEAIEAFITLCKSTTVGVLPPTVTVARRGPSVYASGSTTFGGIPAEFPIGWRVRPIGLTSTLGADGIDPLEFTPIFGRSGSEWRTVTGKSNSGPIWSYTIDSAFGIASGTYEMFFEDPAAFYTIEECEASIAVIYGDIPESSQFIVSASSGRLLPSDDPIIYANDAALYILTDDLGLDGSEVDSTAFGALTNRAIHAAITSPEMSSDIYARMCREFNWIGAHDSIGRETAKNWLGSLGAAAQDYTVANSDIIADSIEGPQMTAIEDIVSMPTVSRSWTQADGFRQVASVLSFGIEPASLTVSNYLQYMTGWDSFAQASEAYAILHANRSRYGVEQRSDVEYKYTSDIQTQLIDDNLLHWISSRKEILEFSVRDNHAGAWATLGKRFAVTHRRYATTTKRGTLVARYWNPEKRTVQLTVMIDPES